MFYNLIVLHIFYILALLIQCNSGGKAGLLSIKM